jgi:hypothetical protein
MSEIPQRIHRRRTRGWRLPANTVCVGRPSVWGNPFTPLDRSWGHHFAVVSAFGTALSLRAQGKPHSLPGDYPSDEAIRAALAGKNLACWCPPVLPCHAAVLLTIANPDLFGTRRDTTHLMNTPTQHHPDEVTETPPVGTVFDVGGALAIYWPYCHPCHESYDQRIVLGVEGSADVVPDQPHSAGLGTPLGIIPGMVDPAAPSHPRDPGVAATCAANGVRPGDRPVVVTLCGSMRVFDDMLTVASEETSAGRIVLAPFTVVAATDQDGDHKAMLDELHRRKIDLSSEIVVVTRDGYLGESTRGEIAYAEQTGRTVRYVEVGR